jgi:hypothetical protein
MRGETCKGAPIEKDFVLRGEGVRRADSTAPKAIKMQYPLQKVDLQTTNTEWPLQAVEYENIIEPETLNPKP